MPKKTIKSKTKTKSTAKSNTIDASRATWLIGLLLVSLVIVTVLGVVSVKKLESETRTDLDVARLAVFDDMAAEFIRDQEIRQDKTIQGRI